jgi:hypothetical protein
METTRLFTPVGATGSGMEATSGEEAIVGMEITGDAYLRLND